MFDYSLDEEILGFNPQISLNELNEQISQTIKDMDDALNNPIPFTMEDINFDLNDCNK